MILSHSDLIPKCDPCEARAGSLRWRPVVVPAKMTELMIRTKVAIILIKWDEI